MVQTDLNTIKTWHKVQLDQLPLLLKEQGFQYVKTFSTSEHRIFVSIDSQYILIIERNVGKLYSTKNRKNCLHIFAIVKNNDQETN